MTSNFSVVYHIFLLKTYVSTVIVAVKKVPTEEPTLMQHREKMLSF